MLLTIFLSITSNANANTISVPATDSDGRFYVSWVTTSSYVELQELDNNNATGTNNWTYLQTGSPTDSVYLQRNIGTYQYRLRICSVKGSRYGSRTTCEIGPSGTIVVGANSAPTITNISDQSINVNSSTGGLSFSIGDNETPASSLILSASSSNTSLVNSTGISISSGTSASSRVVQVSPIANQFGNSNITITVSDGSLSSSMTFNVQVLQQSTGTPTLPPSPLITAPPPEDIASASVSILGGQFRVDESGAASYQVQLKLPSAPGDITPPLSLGYSSGGGNGIMGVGWSVGGLSGISRCRQTKESYGNDYPVTLTSTDRFCLDGQPLVLVSGSYGAINSQYITEIYSGIRVTAKNGSVGNPSYFEVEKEDGSTWTYGNTANARLITNGKNVSWALTTIADNKNNLIEYVYQKASSSSSGFGENEILLDEVIYGGNTVDFQYNSQGTRGDTSMGYIYGVKVERKALLSDILISNHNAVNLISYHFNYQEAAFGSGSFSSQLISIDQCDGSRNGVCTLGDQYEWTEPGNFQFNGALTTLELADESTVFSAFPMDFNGDGFADWVYAYKSGDNYVIRRYRNAQTATGMTFPYDSQVTVHAPGMTRENFRIAQIDFNNDGVIDMMAPQKIGNYFYWHIYQYGTANVINTGIRYEKDDAVADVNSDGRADIVTFNQVHENNGNGFTTKSIEKSDLVSASYITSNSVNGGKVNSPSAFDVDGDGRSEVYIQGYVQQQYTGSQWVTHDWMVSLLPDGNNYRYKTTEFGGSFSESSQRVDVNGDGLSDMVFKVANQWKLRLSQGQYILNVGTNINLPGLADVENVQFGDINQDGNVDMAYLDNSTWRIYSYVGNTWVAVTTTAIPGNLSKDSTNLGMIDFDGDGLADLYAMDYASNKQLKIKRTRSSTLATVTPPNKIASFVNGFGAKTDVNYMSMLADDGDNAFGPVYTKGASVAGNWGNGSPIYNIENAMYLVREVFSDSPGYISSNNYDENNQVSIRYRYEALRAQAGGRGSLGFAKLVTKDMQTSTVTETTYRQDFPYIGMPLTSKTLRYGTHQIDFSENILNSHTMRYQGGLENGRAYMPFIQEAYDNKYHVSLPGNTIAYFGRTKTTNQYKALPTSGTGSNGPLYFAPELFTVETQNRSNSLIKRVTTTNEYSSENLTNWWINRVTKSTVVHHLASAPNDDISRVARFTYNSEGMLETESKGTSYSDMLTTLYCYDSIYGLRTATVTFSKHYSPTCINYMNSIPNISSNSGDELKIYRVNKTEYDTQYRYAKKSYNALNFALNTVTSVNKWQQAQSVVNAISSADASGVVQTIRYDRFGRKYFEQDSTGQSSHSLVRLASDATQIGAPSIAEPYAFVTKTMLAGGMVSFTYSDKIGRNVASVKKGFDGSNIFQYQRSDINGWPIQSSVPSYAISGAGWSTTNYDDLGRVLSETDGKGTVTSRSQSLHNLGILTTTSLTFDTPNQGSRTIVKHTIDNELGQTIVVDDNNNGSSVQTGSGSIRYSYSTSGNLMTTMNVDDVVTSSMTYDDYGRKLSMNDVSKGYWIYSYNALDEIVSQTTPHPVNTKTLYRDVAGRLFKEHNTIGNESVNHVYSASGVHYLAKQQETLKLSSSLKQQVNYYYDDFNRIQRIKTYTSPIGQQPAMTYVQQKTYDQYGRAFQLFDPDDDSDLVGCFNDAGTQKGHCNGVQNHYNAHGYLFKQTEARVGVSASGNDIFMLITGMDALGNTTEANQGQHIKLSSNYDAVTGLVNYGIVKSGSTTIQFNNYEFDDVGTLWERERLDLYSDSSVAQYREVYGYDAMQRLTHLDGIEQVKYFQNGNIKWKRGVDNGSSKYYCYRATNPYAVSGLGSNGCATNSYQYDAKGNMISGKGRNIIYSHFDKATYIEKSNSEHTSFHYGTNRSRHTRVDVKDGVTTTTAYIGNIEVIRKSNESGVQTRRSVPGAVINHYSSTGVASINFMHKDHLGSLNTITNANGKIVSKMVFDAWGKRTLLAKSQWSNFAQSKAAVTLYNLFDVQEVTTRGYTGHEGVDNLDIIHMNGRIYDPILGRFLQSDPFIQASETSQSYNRYSYVINNPLSLTDPSGYFFSAFKSVGRRLIRSATKVFGAEVVNFVGSIASFACGPAAPACAAYWTYEFTRAHGGSSSQALRGAFTSAATTFAFQQIGGHFKGLSAKEAGPGLYDFGGNFLTGNQVTQQITAHAIVGGISSELQGGKFGHGFLAAGVTKGFGGAFLPGGGLHSRSELIKNTLISAVIGGTVSVISGGKFANGARTSAFQYLFNQTLSRANSVSKKGRALTVDEITEAKKVFGNKIDYSRVRIIDGKYVPWQGKGYIIAPNGNIYWPGECGNLASCGGTGVAGVFIHEMTHVYQHQHGVNVLFRGFLLQAAKFLTFGLYDPYKFTYDAGRQFSSYNIEQQGDYARGIYFGQYPNKI